MNCFGGNLFLIKAAIVVGSGGFIFGYDIGVIAGALTQITDEFNLTSWQEGLVVSILYAGAILGCLVGGPMCDRIGRWKTIHIQNAFFIVGALVTAWANSLAVLCVGRFIIGIASALSGIADIPYLTEISPPQHRGILTLQYEIAVGVGVLASFAVDLVFSNTNGGWRIDFTIPAVMALLQSVGMCFLPESPKWLTEKGRLTEAHRSLCAIYGGSAEGRRHLSLNDTNNNCISNSSSKSDQDVLNDGYSTSVQNVRGSSSSNGHVLSETEIPQDILDYQQAVAAAAINVDRERGCSSNSGIKSQSVSQDEEKEEGFIKAAAEAWNQYQHPLYIMIALQIFSQVTGGVVVRNYAPTIFEQSGVSSFMSLVFNLVLGVVKLIFTIISVMHIETTGRLKLLLYGICLVGLGTLILAIGSLFYSDGNLRDPVVYVIGCSLVVGGYGVGFGPIPWVLSSEMFPTVIRGRIMSISLITSNAAQLGMNMVFLLMTDNMTTAGTFGFFFVMTLACFSYVCCFCVETKSISPADILLRVNQRRKVLWMEWRGAPLSCLGREVLCPCWAMFGITTSTGDRGWGRGVGQFSNSHSSFNQSSGNGLGGGSSSFVESKRSMRAHSNLVAVSECDSSHGGVGELLNSAPNSSSSITNIHDNVYTTTTSTTTTTTVNNTIEKGVAAIDGMDVDRRSCHESASAISVLHASDSAQ